MPSTALQARRERIRRIRRRTRRLGHDDHHAVELVEPGRGVEYSRFVLLSDRRHDEPVVSAS